MCYLHQRHYMELQYAFHENDCDRCKPPEVYRHEVWTTVTQVVLQKELT